MTPRWCIYIDVEGFSALYERDGAALAGLGPLMEAIHSIGARCFPISPRRLFAHQTGDGFAIVSEFGSDSLEVPVASAIAILRHVASAGYFCKASIGEGTSADITGCYPKDVSDAIRDRGGAAAMGDGLMTVFSVMGTAFINAHSNHKRSPSGPLLTVAAAEAHRLPHGCLTTPIPRSSLISVDWIHSDVARVTKLQSEAGLSAPSNESIEATVCRYSETHCLTGAWLAGLRMLGFTIAASHP